MRRISREGAKAQRFEAYVLRASAPLRELHRLSTVDQDAFETRLWMWIEIRKKREPILMRLSQFRLAFISQIAQRNLPYHNEMI